MAVYSEKEKQDPLYFFYESNANQDGVYGNFFCMSGQRIKLAVFILSFKEILNNILSCDQGNPSLRGNKYF